MRASVKRGIAAASATALGAGGALAASSPALAEPVAGAACDDIADHAISASPLTDFYMECVPQFGEGPGKADLIIEGDPDFPVGFVPLSDPSVEATNPLEAEIGAYFGVSGVTPGFTQSIAFESADTTSSPQTQTYTANGMVFPVTGIESIPPSELPEGCGETSYDGAWRVDYGAATTTFVQVIDGEQWSYDVEVAPPSLYLGLNFDGPAFDTAAAQCASNGVLTLYAGSNAESYWSMITTGSAIRLSPFPVPGPFGYSYGAFAPTTGPVPGEDEGSDPAEEETLPATGADPAGIAALGALLVGLGVAAGWLTNRRRTSRA